MPIYLNAGRLMLLRAWIFCTMSSLLLCGCRDLGRVPQAGVDPMIEAIRSVSALADTAEVSARLERIADSLSGRSPSLDIRIALKDAQADLLRRRGMPDSGFSMLVQGMDLALRAGDSLALAGVLLDMGRWNGEAGRFNTARTFSERALAIYRRHGSEKDIAAALDAAAFHVQSIGNYPAAQALLLEALQLHERAGDTAKTAQVYNLIGTNYADLGEVDKAMDSYRRSAGIISKTQDSARLATAYSNIGLMYRRTDPDSALYYYDLALGLTSGTRHRLQYVICLFNQANIHYDRKQYNEARRIYDTVMALCQRYQFVDGIPRVLSGYAAIAEESHDYQAARSYMSSARRMADSSGQSMLALWLRREELDAAVKRRDIDSVISLSKDIRRREDSIAGTEKKALMAELELRYRVEDKEREIGSLRSKLAGRQWIIGLLLCLTAALAALILLYRRQRRVLTQRNRSYESMIARYQSERDRILKPASDVGALSSEPEASDPPLVPDTAIPEEGSEAGSLAAETLADYQRILALLRDEKLYTRPRIKAEELAERVGISARKLTVVLRAQGEDGFNALLNRFRIAEATRLMEDPGSHNLKLDTLAERCGFNSRQHFYRVFEQVTGVNPGYYRKRFGTDAPPDGDQV